MITFLGLTDRTAGLIRGKQVSERIKNSEFLNVHSLQHAKNKICIFVRNHFEDSVKIYKKRGHIVGYDMCDVPVGDVFFRNDKNPSLIKHCHEIYDFYIVNNNLAYAEIKSFTSKPVFVIPHHTVNIDSKKNEVKNEVKTVGYVGLKEQFSRSEEIENYLKAKNINFLSVHPSSRDECDKIFQDIDIGLIFLDESTATKVLIDVVKKYKPNTKLSNFQSYGIPTITVGYDSYKQFGENAYIEVDSFASLLTCTSNLIDSKFLRLELSEKAYSVGQKFHIDNVVKSYMKILDTL